MEKIAVVLILVLVILVILCVISLVGFILGIVAGIKSYRKENQGIKPYIPWYAHILLAFVIPPLEFFVAIKELRTPKSTTPKTKESDSNEKEKEKPKVSSPPKEESKPKTVPSPPKEESKPKVVSQTKVVSPLKRKSKVVKGKGAK